MEGLEQSNAGLTSSNSAVMAQLVQMNATMNAMKAQSKTSTNPTRTRRKNYCWSRGRNFTHGVKHAPKIRPQQRGILQEKTWVQLKCVRMMVSSGNE